MSARVGRWVYYRGKGSHWLDIARAWVVPVMAGSAATKYLGLQSRWALAAWIAIALVAEVAAILIGWWAHRSGVTEADYAAAVEKDPFRRESLELARESRNLLRALEVHVREASRAARRQSAS